MSEKIEEVARALWADSHVRPFDAASEAERRTYRRHARVAIEAMRRPTQAMVDAGNRAANVWNSNLSYPEMIAATLSPEPHQ